MKGLFITFEGNEGSGKSTQIKILAESLSKLGHKVRTLREPGGTPIGEEIRHTLKHSAQNHAMTPETELLLMNASRAQLVREVIRPALDAGEIVLCDRFYDSTTVYQGFGRQIPLEKVRPVIEFAVGETIPDITFLLNVPLDVSEARRNERSPASGAIRDRIEEAGREFFKRVESGYQTLAKNEPARFIQIDATQPVGKVTSDILARLHPLLAK